MSAAVAGVAIGLGTFAYGEEEKSQAKKKASQLQATRPKLQDSPYTKDELALTQSELANGMGADASRFAKEEQDSSLSDSLDALLKSGGSNNNISKLFDGSVKGDQRLAMTKENLRLNEIQNVIGASRNAEEGRQQQFQFNEWAPWSDEAQANAQAKKGADETINSGLNTAESGALQELDNINEKNEYDDYFNPKKKQVTV
jgi:hypothetical protein